MKKAAAPAPTAYAAFLRGINVGGNRVIKMADIKVVLGKIGWKDIKTVGASGNLLFSASAMETGALVTQLESALQKAFGHKIPVIIRSLEQLREMAAAEPFQKVTVTPNTRLYVTFLPAPTKSKSGLKFPFKNPDFDMSILKVTDGEIFSVVELSPAGGTIEATEIIEKEFGKHVTTRNWNTIKKLT